MINTYDQTTPAYSYNADGVFTGIVFAHLDVLESKKKAVYNLPANAIFTAPKGELAKFSVWQINVKKTGWKAVSFYIGALCQNLATGELVTLTADDIKVGDELPPHLSTEIKKQPITSERKTAQWNADKKDWDMVDDWREFQYWLADGTSHTILEIGEKPPSNALLEKPAPTAEQQEKALQAEATRAVQSYLDDEAKKYGYDNIATARIPTADPYFSNQQQEFDKLWAGCWRVMLKIETGEITQPETITELLTLMPKLDLTADR